MRTENCNHLSKTKQLHKTIKHLTSGYNENFPPKFPVKLQNKREENLPGLGKHMMQ